MWAGWSAVDSDDWMAVDLAGARAVELVDWWADLRVASLVVCLVDH